MRTRRRLTKSNPEEDARLGALVIHPLVGDGAGRDPAERLNEACGLAEALDLVVLHREAAALRRIHPGGYFGEGRIQALKALGEHLGAALVIVDASLSPVQQRTLETALGMKVVDRTGLILEIFGRRARTREGRLQVELARLAYERSRLVRTWTHLERQRGGLGKTGGPGESQLEIDRRLIAGRIDKLKAELEEVRRTRGLQRNARARAGLPSVALAGYTNAGKSSLFNRLTQAGVLAKNMPFATLDPTARQVRLPSGRTVILTDTVGFISDLPHELVESFRATLEEVALADVLIHVRDVAHAEAEAQKRDVEGVLAQILATDEAERPAMIEVWNKIDLLSPERRAARRARAADDETPVVAVSALTGEGMDELLALIDRLAYGPTQTLTLRLDPADGRRRAWIASKGKIVEESLDAEGWLLVVAELPREAAAQAADMVAGEARLAAE